MLASCIYQVRLMYLISNCVVRRSCAIKQDLENQAFFAPLFILSLSHLGSTHTNPTHHVLCLFNFFKSKMRQDSEENILMFFTRLCIEELERSSPEVKVSELYMRRRCRERWARMGEKERAAIFRLAGGQEDLDDNNYPSDGADAVEVEVDDEWQPEKKRKRSQSQRRPSAYNAFCLVEREKRGHKISNRCLNQL